MTPEQLVQELETLPHVVRIRRMVEVGRSAANDETISTMLDTMSQGTVYERWLALHACFGSRNSAHVMRVLHDPVGRIRALAVRLLPHTCNEEQLQEALHTLSGRLRLFLLWKVWHCGHTALIDTFLETLVATEDRELPQLLPFGSRDTVSRHIQVLRRKFDRANWCRLARLHPDLALRELQQWVEQTTFPDPQIIWLFNILLPSLLQEPVERLLPLLTLLLEHIDPSLLTLQPLVDRYPVAMADFVISSPEYIPVTFNNVTHRLQIGQILALIERNDESLDIGHEQYHPTRLDREQILAIYAKFRKYMSNVDECLPPYIIALLPPQQREQEARFHLTLPKLAVDPLKRLPYATFLPWDEALAYLKPFLRSPDLKLRTVALESLVATVRYQRSHLSDLLAILQKHENEPAPVRAAFLQALTKLPWPVWKQEHLPALETLLDQALHTADMVSYHYNLMEVATIYHDSTWCSEQIIKILLQRKDLEPSIEDLFSWMPPEGQRQVIALMTPVFEQWQDQRDIYTLTRFANNCGEYLKLFETVIQILERVLHETNDGNEADRILSLFLASFSDRVENLIPQLLQQDTSWLLRKDVTLYLLQKRQDLLTPFLQGAPIKGRFGSGKIQYILRDHCLASGYHRYHANITVLSRSQSYLWALTAHQQILLRDILLNSLHTEEQQNVYIVDFIRMLSVLPEPPVQDLSHFTKHDLSFINETALYALARLETEESLPLLLEALDDKRVRIAVYGLKHFLLKMPVEQALSLLKSIPQQKVTVTKEVVRLLSELPFEEAYQELLRMEQQELHRDVRIALLRSLWRHLERPETWQILERHARSYDVDIALSTLQLQQIPNLSKQRAVRKRVRRKIDNRWYNLSNIPYGKWIGKCSLQMPMQRFTREVQRQIMKLFVIALQHPRAEVWYRVLEYCHRVPPVDNDDLLLTTLFTSMGAEVPGEREAAAHAIFSSCSVGDATAIAQFTSSLADKPAALQALVNALWQALVCGRKKEVTPVVYAVLEVLTNMLLTIGLQVDLALFALSGEEVVAFLKRLTTNGELHADALQKVCTRIRELPVNSEQGIVALLERLFADESDEHLRRIGLAALVARSGSPDGWNDERRQMLQVYQKDPSPLVAEVARFTFPSEQE